MQSEPVISRNGVNQGFIPQQQPNETPELKARLAAVLQLYNEVMKENEQLKEVIKRGEEIARCENKNLKDTLIARDGSIGVLQVEVEKLKRDKKASEALLDRKYSVLEKQLKVEKNENVDLKKRNMILLSALSTLSALAVTPFCLENSPQAMDIYEKRMNSANGVDYINKAAYIAHRQQITNLVENLTKCVNETNKKLLKV